MVVLVLGCAAVVGDLSGSVRPAATGDTVRSVEPPEPAARLTPPRDQGAPAFAGPRLPTEPIAPASAGSPGVWFAHGRWWAVLPTAGTGSQHVWALAGPDGPWVDTGVLVDDRAFAAVQVVWTGRRLVIASTGSRSYLSHGLRISGFSWISAEGRWDRDQDFPVTLTSGGAAGTRMAVTDDGRVWLARPDGDRILVGSTDAAGQGFEGLSPLPGGIAGADVGGFDLVAEGDELRLVWRSRRRDAVGEAVMRDGSWSAATRPVYGVRGDGPIDAVAAGGARPGEVLVALATTLGDRGTNEFDPSLLVLALDDERTRVSVAALNRDRIRHPALMVDEGGGRVGVVALTGAPAASGGDNADPPPPAVVTEKWADIDDLAFATGPGQVVLANALAPAASTSPIDLVAPMVPASPISDASGSVLVAAAPDAGVWVTAPRGVATPGAAPHVEDGPVVLVEDTFEGLRIGGPPPSAWRATSGDRLPGRVVAGDGNLNRSLAVQARRDGGRTGACRALPASERRLLRVWVVVRPLGSGSASARVVSLRGPGGNAVGMWLTRRREIEWLTPGGRIRTRRVVPDGAALRVAIEVDRTAHRASITVDGAAGPVAAVDDLSLGASDVAGFEEVCVAPAEGNPSAALRLDELVVTAGD